MKSASEEVLPAFRPNGKLRKGVYILFLTATCALVTGCGRPSDQSAIIDAQVRRPDIFSKVIHFNESGEAQPFQISGWSGTEKNSTWSIGRAAVLAIPIPATSSGLRLRLYVNAYTHPPELPTQPVEVYANGQKVAHWDVAAPAQYTVDIPNEIVNRSKTLRLEFQTPRAISPASLVVGGDPRVLGICCHEMELTELP